MIQQAHNNLYNMLMNWYDINHFIEERHNQIPSILAVLAIMNDDRDTLEEIIEKFGQSAFTTVIGPWATYILEQLRIEMSKRPDSPTSIQCVETKSIE